MNNIIQDLIRSYSNECNTKKILPYQNQIVEDLSAILRSQKLYIEELLNNKINTEMNKTIISIYQLDYERVSFFLTIYLKTRLKKINNFGKFIEDMNYLSSYEKNYLNRIIEFEKSYEKDENTKPPPVYKLQDNNEYVGFYVLCETKSIKMDGNPLEIRNGDVFVCLLSDVYDLLLKNEIVLL
jgi:hypothetical protein